MHFIVTLHNDARSRIDEIAHTLQLMGNSIDRRLKLTGIITGNTSKDVHFSDLEKVEGVKKVEKDRAVYPTN